MKVRSTDPDEFLSELQVATPNTEPVLRATVQHQLDRETRAFAHLTVVATYLRQVGEETISPPLVVRLESYSGADWGPEFEPRPKARKRAEELLDRLTAAANALGLECRPGVYEP